MNQNDPSVSPRGRVRQRTVFDSTVERDLHPLNQPACPARMTFSKTGVFKTLSRCKESCFSIILTNPETQSWVL